MFCLCLKIAHLAHARRNCNNLIFSPKCNNIIVVLRQCLIAHSHTQTCKSQMQDLKKMFIGFVFVNNIVIGYFYYYYYYCNSAPVQPI